VREQESRGGGVRGGGEDENLYCPVTDILTLATAESGTSISSDAPPHTKDLSSRQRIKEKTALEEKTEIFA